MSYRIKNILVPTDFLESANNALRVAIHIAEANKAKIHLINAISMIGFMRHTNVHGQIVNLESQLIKDTHRNLAKHKKEVRQQSTVSVSTHAEISSVKDLVNKYVEDKKIDLIVMGTHGASGFKKYFLGTNTFDVIKSASCPVLSIPLNWNKLNFDNILYPVRKVDGVLDKYYYLKPLVGDNCKQIHLLGITDEENKGMEKLISYITDIIGIIKDDCADITQSVYKKKDVSSYVLKRAKKINADLLVINASLDKKWYNFFTGTYTEEIINHADLPVLSIKPELTDNIQDEYYNLKENESKFYVPFNNV